MLCVCVFNSEGHLLTPLSFLSVQRSWSKISDMSNPHFYTGSGKYGNESGKELIADSVSADSATALLQGSPEKDSSSGASR